MWGMRNQLILQNAFDSRSLSSCRSHYVDSPCWWMLTQIKNDKHLILCNDNNFSSQSRLSERSAFCSCWNTKTWSIYWKYVVPKVNLNSKLSGFIWQFVLQESTRHGLWVSKSMASNSMCLVGHCRMPVGIVVLHMINIFYLVLMFDYHVICYL